MERRLTKRATQAWLIFLALLMAITGMAVLGVMGNDLFHKLFSPTHDLPKILILTDDMLKAGYDANKAVEDENKGFDPAIQAEIAKERARTQGSGSNAKPDAIVPSTADPAHTMRGQSFATLQRAMADGVAIELSAQLQNSKMFTAVPLFKISDAIVDLQLAPKADVSHSASGITQSEKGKKAEEEKKKTDQAIAEGHGPLDPSITNIANKVGAKYVLTVSVSEPRFEVRVRMADLANPSPYVELTANPIIMVQIARSDNAGVPEQFQILSRPVSQIVEIVEAVNQHPEYHDALKSLTVALNRSVAAQIVRELLDRYAPPSIAYAAENGTYAIDRGEDSKVKVGAAYDVMRDVGDEVIGSGADGTVRELGRDHVRVGSIRISRVDKLKAYAIAADGGPFKLGDKVYPAKNGQSGGSSAGGPDGVPAGHRLAIYPMTLNLGGKQATSDQLTEAVTDGLTRDARVQVIMRTDTAAVINERKLSRKMASDDADDDDNPAAGMAQSDYLITGEFSMRSQTQQKSSSFWGIVEKRGSVTTTHVTGRLVATTTEGGVRRYSVEASGGTLQAAAADGVVKLLAQMFPAGQTAAAGSSVPASAPFPAPTLAPAQRTTDAPAPRPAKAHPAARHRAAPSDASGGLQF